MAVLRGTNVTLANNKVYENYGEGLGCFTSTNCLIQDNTIYDNFSAELYIANSTNVTAERNLIYSKGNTAYFRNLSGVWGPATGILLGDEGCGDPVRITLNNVIVRNNIVVNGRNGFTYAAFDCFDHGMQTTQVVNNTFYGSTEALLVINYNSNNTGNSVANNIFFQTKGKPITMLGDLKSVTYSNNLWFGGAPESVAVSQSDLRADPLFSVPGSVRAIDYQFKTGSPAIDKGKAISATFNDYFGTVRPSGNSYDIGAYEFRYFSTARSSGKSHNISANEPRESHEAMRSRILPQRKVQQPRLNLCQKSIREAFSSASISRQKTTSSRQARQQLMQGRRSGQQPTLPSAVPTRLARATTAAHTSSVRPCDRASYPSTKPNPT
jgi:parallel beta-helix repeat protein